MIPETRLFIIKRLLAVFLLLAGGCAGERIEPLSGDTIIHSSIGDASYLNPVLSSDSASSFINNLVFNGLVKYDKDLMLTGDLAESWEVSDDGLVINFTLREGVKWHDGEPFTSDDVLYTYRMLTATGTRTPHSSRFDRVRSVDAPDDYTVRVEYSEPYAPALESWGMGIIPRHLFEGEDINTTPLNRSPVGTGPYRFVNWRPDDRVILEANPEYFEGEPRISRVIYKVIPDQAVQFMELRRGSVDWMSPTPDQWVSETGRESFLEEFNRFRYPSFQYTYMGYNLENELFSDLRVRKAINYAVDKESLIDAVLQGLGGEATGPYPPHSWAFNPDIKDAGYNPEKALNLLEEAGWVKNSDGILEKDGRRFSFTLMTNQGNTMRAMTCEIIQAQLREIGMDVRVRIQEWSSFVHQYVDQRQFDAIIMGWSLTVDPDNYSIWHSSQRGEGQYNFAGYVNPEVDRLLEKGRSVFDIEERQRIYRRIHAIIAAEQPYLFLYVPDSRSVIHRRFKNISVEKSGIGHNFIEWYVPDEKRKY